MNDTPPCPNATPDVKHSMPAGERIALNAAMLRLFKNEHRESSDRHSDALFVRDGLEVALEEIYNLKRELALSQQDYRLLMADLKLVAEARTQLTRQLAAVTTERDGLLRLIANDSDALAAAKLNADALAGALEMARVSALGRGDKAGYESADYALATHRATGGAGEKKP